jgi:peptide/nickel transport system substrate-binding protein
VLRGFRWQLLLLFAAIILLGVAIILQPETTDETPAPPTPTATTAAPQAASAPTPIPPQNIATPVVFREGLVGQVQRLNPLFAGLNQVDSDIVSLIFEGLVGTNAYGEYVPRLAKDWTITSDGLEYVFRLREDVLWQDGLPFTAADVLATIGLLQAPGDSLPEELTEFWRTVELELLDETTLRFRLAQPLAAFLDHLRIGILPAHVFSGLAPEQIPGHAFNLSPIGTGPYQLETLTGDSAVISSVDLRVAPVYRQRPEGQSGYEFERLTFTMFDTQDAALVALQTGEIDALNGVENDDLAALVQFGTIRLDISTVPVIGTILFNWESEHTPAFRDQRTRQALVAGADRIGLVNRHMSGHAVVADSPIVPGSWAYSGPIIWPDYNPGAAMQLLEQVSFAPPEPDPAEESESAETAPEEEDTESTATPTALQPSYDFSLLSSDNPAHIALAADLAAQWTQLGLTIRTEVASHALLQDRLESGLFDVALVELSLSPHADPDPYTFWHQGQYQTGQNYGGINDRHSSELLEKARRDPNGIHRAEYYTEFQRLFANRALAMLLYYPITEYAVATNVEGIQIGFMSSPADRFQSIARWTLID